MTRAASVLPENEHVRGLVGLVVAVAFLVWVGDVSPVGVAPLVVLLGGMLVVDVLQDRFDLPDGTDRLGLGVLVTALAVPFAAFSDPVSGVVLAAVGVWIGLDGYTAVRAPDESPHPLADGLDDDSGEAMLRMQTLNVVNQALQDSEEPRTVADVAADLELTESRAGDALSFLETKGYAEETQDGYRATPPRWGRLHPVVAFATWLPRRLVRPFARLARDSRADEK